MSKEKKSLKEKLSGTVAEVNKTGADNFEMLAGNLQRDIPKIAVNFHEKLMELEAVGAHKENSKIKYRRALDAGLEESMAECLRGIREKNEMAKKLRSELARFPEEIKKLYSLHTKMFGLAQADQVSSATKVREAEKVLTAAAERVRRCYGLMGQVNELNSSVNEIMRGFEKEKKTSEAEIKTPRSSEAGFWLELDDPFGQGELRHYQKLKDVDGLSLPLLLNFKDREKISVDENRLKEMFEKSEALKDEFGDLKTYIEFESLIVVQILKSYILRANGGGDRRRGFAGQAALSKCK